MVQGKKLAVLVLQYNSSDFTIQLLSSIQQFEGGNWEKYRFIVMDNASRDPQREAISSRYPWVEFVQFSENHGFAGAHNRIMELIGEDWVLLLNNDCVLLNDAITRTLLHASALNADFATCAVFNEDMSVQKNFGTLPSPLRKIFLNLTGIARIILMIRKYMVKSRVGYINGAFLLIRKDSIPDAKLFDDRYFMYTEDLDLMYRLNKMGAKGYRFTDGKAIHLGGQSAKRKWKSQDITSVKETQALDCMSRHFPVWQVTLMRFLYKVIGR